MNMPEWKRDEILGALWESKAWKPFVILLVCWGLFLIWKFALKRFEIFLFRGDVIRESEMILRLKTMFHVLKWCGSITVIGLGLYMLLESLGINVAPLLAGAGIVGLAFGFGGQYLIRDVINGIFILLEGQYRINDVVQIGEHGGLVESVNLRITQLRDLEGRVIFIPNGEIKTVINFTKEYSYALLNVGVAYETDINHAIDVIKELGHEMRKDRRFGPLILEGLEMFGVTEFAESQMTIQFRIKTLPIKQWDVAREFRRRLKARFDAEKIEIPYPHRTLSWGTKENKNDFRNKMGAG